MMNLQCRLLVTQQTKLAVLFVFILLISGCRGTADRFFSGRPSPMAMAHNRVLDGSLDSMIDLMRIPSRFPDADPSHIVSWQESAIAWWRDAGGRERYVRALSELTAPEIDKLEVWIAARGDATSTAKTLTLEEIAHRIISIRTPTPKVER
jgi:hypothetical protein